MSMPSGRPIGRNAAEWTKKIGAVCAVLAIAGAFGAGRARADDSQLGLAIAAEAQSTAAAAVATAMAASSDAIARTHAQVPTVATMEATTVVPSANADLGDAIATAATDTRTVEPAAPRGAAVERVAPPKLAEPRKSRPRAMPQVRGRHTERNALAAPAPDPVRLVRALRSDPGTPTGSRRARRPTAPSRPAPLSPSTPAPGNPGVSWSGQGGGQGAFPTPLPAAIAGFLLLAFAFGLRRVIWWARPLPGRVALTPWRPG
jgi:hypothetical protein